MAELFLHSYCFLLKLSLQITSQFLCIARSTTLVKEKIYWLLLNLFLNINLIFCSFYGPCIFQYENRKHLKISILLPCFIIVTISMMCSLKLLTQKTTINILSMNILSPPSISTILIHPLSQIQFLCFI